MTDSAARPYRVAIIGGGIAGLSAAYALERARREEARVLEYVLLEASGRLGGNIRSERVGPFLLDAGPDSFMTVKPDALELCKRLGLEGELVAPRPGAGTIFVAQRGRLIPLPEGLMFFAPTRALPLLRTPLLSWRAKLRIGLDLLIPPRRDDEDESMSAFVARRMGREAAELFAGALMSAIYGGDPDELSIRSTFPQLVAMERAHGSLIRAALASARSAAKHPNAPPAFLTPRSGMEAIVSALVAQLDPKALRLHARARALGRGTGTRWAIELAEGSAEHADAVILAVPPHVASRLLHPVLPDAATLLARVPSRSSATVFFAFERKDIAHPLDGSGFLVPRREGSPIIAGTFVSSKWPERAPEGTVLLRVMLGGARDPEALFRSDAELLATAFEGIRSLLGVSGRPTLQALYRHEHATPQMLVGHAQRMAVVSSEITKLGGLRLAGAGYNGSGVPECVRSGQAAATSLLAEAPLGAALPQPETDTHATLRGTHPEAHS